MVPAIWILRKDYFPVFYYAKNCGYAEPPQTSGWFLPSVYQWQQVFLSMGKSRSEMAKNITSIINSQNIPTSVGQDLSGAYWTCTEYNDTYAMGVTMNSGSISGGYVYTYKQATESYNVRAMLAF
jgi:hypothetical protein